MFFKNSVQLISNALVIIFNNKYCLNIVNAFSMVFCTQALVRGIWLKNKKKKHNTD